MNNDTLTEQNIIAWLRNRAAQYQISGLTLKIDGSETYNCIASARSSIGFGGTIDIAVADLRARMDTPGQIRQRAADLLAEAEAIEKEGGK
jgi:hypothetical protein